MASSNDILPDDVFESTPTNQPMESDALLPDSVFAPVSTASSSPSGMTIEQVIQKAGVNPQSIPLLEPTPITAAATGAVKGMGQLGVNALNLLNRVGSWFDEPGTTTPVSATAVPNLPASLGAYQQQAFPNYFKAGEIAGEGAPWLLAPEARVVEGLGGVVSPAAENFLNKNLLGRMVSGAGNNALLGAAAAPLYNPNAPLSQSLQQGAQGGALLGGLLPLPLAGLGAAGRLADVTTASAEKAQQAAGDAYDLIKSAAPQFRTTPTLYMQNLESELNNMSGSRYAKNSDLENELYDRLDAAENEPKNNPNVFSVADTHSQLQQLNDQIAQAMRQGENNKARVYQGLRDSLKTDMLNSLRQQGLGDLADQFTAAQENYKNNVIPLKENPTSLGQTARNAAILGLLAKLPPSAETLGGVTFGLHGAGNPIMNVFRRYGSTYNGGPWNLLSGPTIDSANRAALMALMPSAIGASNQ